MKSHCALILPGAVAKGAFEAGIIDTLVERNTRIDRIIATSSGALNGVAFAAGIRNGCEKEMVSKLINAWVDGGAWYNSLRFSPGDLIRRRGLSNRNGLLKMLHDVVTPCAGNAKREVELRIIVTPLQGVQSSIGKTPATTYEKLLRFSGKDFDTEEGLAKIFEATTAACAFPGLFAPVEIPGLGLCVDGGTVNNAPIEYALEEGDVNHIIMAVPFPAIVPVCPSLHGFGMANHMIDILINERLYRDLKDANVVNAEVEKLEKLVTDGVLSSEQLSEVQSILKTRKVKITDIRPSKSIGQNAFSGFFSKKNRMRLVDEGRNAAREALNRST
jgi:predicted acylesterase/phospholipase RssA